MSRLADALSRAGGRDPVADLRRETDHLTAQSLWGIDRPDTALLDDPIHDSPLHTPALHTPAQHSAAQHGPTLHSAAIHNTAVLEATPVVPFERSTLPVRDDRVERHLTALVDRVFLPISGEPNRFVAFASTGAEVTSGSLTATAAAMLAERTTGTICVIDGNFHQPSLHQYFGIASEPGLAEAFANEAPLLDSASRIQRNLWVLPAGLPAGRRLFDSAVTRQRMSQFVSQFDYVLLDVEPVGASGYGSGLLRLVGGVIVVVAADSTRREVARRATQALTEAGVAVIGAVLTNQQDSIANPLARLL